MSGSSQIVADGFSWRQFWQGDIASAQRAHVSWQSGLRNAWKVDVVDVDVDAVVAAVLLV